MTTPITYNLAPVPRWLFTDLTGKILSNGTMFTCEDLDHSMNKVAYKDVEGLYPWTDPIPFELNGMPNGALYWASDSNYYLAVFDQFDVPQFTVSHYNAPFADSINTAPTFITNFVRNPQFTYWSNSTNYPAIGFSQSNTDFVSDDWLYFRNNTNATINISQQLFLAGQTDVPSNPIGYFHYECTNAGAGGMLTNSWAQQYNSVQTLSGETVTIAFYAKSSLSNSITVYFKQNFGSGGSTEVTTTAISINALTSTWQQYTATVTIPSIVGKTIGAGDNLEFGFNFPLNTVASIDICNVQDQLGTELSDFPYTTSDDQAKRLDSIALGIYKTGDFKLTLRPSADPGWIQCLDQTIGSQSSGATAAGIGYKGLFLMVWNQVANAYAPIFNSDGTVGTRGSTAEEDYNANKRLATTKTLGRVLASAGTAVLTQTFTAYASQTFTRSSNELVLTSSAGFFTGTPITFTTTGTLPSPLVDSTTYYAIFVDATHISVATTQANALAGTAITLTTDGTGVQTVIQTGVLNVNSNASSYYTGIPVTLTTTGTLPSSLALATTYYVINYDPTSTYIALATTLVNAINGVAIILTDGGTGIQTVQINYTAFQPGQFTGEFFHNMTINEMVAHDHPGSSITGNQSNGGGGSNWVEFQSDANNDDDDDSLHIASQGGSQPMNITQPTTFVNCMLKL